MVPNHEWTERQECTDEARRDYECERLIAWTLDAIAERMEAQGITKADMARKLGCSRAHVTQVMSGSRNATLRTIAEFAWACGLRAVMQLEPLRSGPFISQPAALVSPRGQVVPFSRWRVSSEEPRLLEGAR